MAAFSSHLIGTVVARRFQVREAIASGGMGLVYRAHDLRRDETVALKVLLAQQSDAILRFQREVQILHELHHPAIVRPISHGALATGQLYLVMEWLEGEDLGQRLGRQPLSVEESVELGVAVASALEAAHVCGVVHRDIKPSNLFLRSGQTSEVKVVDFGVAQLSGSSTVTQDGALIGTPEYMSPEQLRGERDLDARTDLFSLGCVLFQCLSGRHPFHAASTTGVLSKILMEPAPDLAALRPELPQPLCALVGAMLTKDRGGRPSRAEEVLEVLRGIQITDRLLLGEAATVLAPRRLHLTTREQRLLSLVMIVPDSSNLMEDATLAAAPESDWLKTVEALAVPFDGRCDRLPDGSVLILLTGQPTASDQARQAARLALRVRAYCEGADTGRPGKLQLAVATRRGDIEDGVLSSGSIDRVLGLLARAEQQGPGQTDSPAIPIWIDEMTRGLLGEQFQTRGADGVALLLGEQEAAESAQRVLGRRTPFFGRDAELRLLSSVLGHSIAEPCARIVLITAEAGAGKTRLSQEFLARARAEDPERAVWIGSGHPLRAGSPFALLAQSLRQGLGLSECADHAQQRELLRRELAALLSETGLERERVAEFIGELLGIQPETPASAALQAARISPMLMGDQIRRAVLELLTAACAQRPLLWVIEDLHWCDRPSVWLIDAALRQLAERPLCVIALARPNVREIFPDLWRSQPLQELRLRPLPRKASEQIARQMLGGSQPLDDILNVLEKARGNPFFLEEMLRAAAAGRLAQIPPTVLAMVQSRIEQLDAGARRALRAASVFGPIFWRRGVLHLIGSSSSDDKKERELFDALVQCELIRQNPAGRFAGEEEYGFAHALVRDAAYAMMTDSDRSLGHRLAAEFLEAAGEEDALVLADHWQRGGQSIHAVAWFRKAAWQALEGNDLDAVLLHAEQAVDCGATGLELGEVNAAQAEAHQWRGTYREVVRHAHLAMELLPPQSQRWFQVAGALAIAAGRLLDNPQLRLLCERLQQLAEAGEASDAFVIAAVRTALQAYIAGDYPRANALLGALAPLMSSDASRSPAAAAMIYLLRANRAGYAWQLDLCPRYYEQSARLFEQIGDQRNAASQNFDAAVAYLDIGDFRRTEELTREIIAIADRLSLRRLSTACYRVLGAALYYVGRHGESREMNRRSLEQAEAAGDRRTGGACQIILALLEVAGGNLAEAERLAGAAQMSLIDLPSIRARALAVLSELQLAQGRTEEALRNGEAAYGILQALGRLESREAVVRLSYSEALRATGAAAAIEQADEILRVGRERLLAQAACIADPEARRGFLSLPDPARLLRRCAELKLDTSIRSTALT